MGCDDTAVDGAQASDWTAHDRGGGIDKGLGRGLDIQCQITSWAIQGLNKYEDLVALKHFYCSQCDPPVYDG